MTLEEYSEWVKARHPYESTTQAVLGLVSEAGEVAQVLRKHPYAMSDEAARDMILELGDVLHYATLAAVLLGTTVPDVYAENVLKQTERDGEVCMVL